MDVETALDLIRPHLRGLQVCVQAGARDGVWPVALASVFETVYTFEPYENATAILAVEPHPNIRLSTNALGEQAGSSGMSIEGFELARGNLGAAYLKGDGDVSVITIDSLELPACDLIYLDIEGMEYRALQGAVKTIHKYRPVIGVEKKHLGRYGSSLDDIRRFLSGYREVGGNHLDVIFACE